MFPWLSLAVCCYLIGCFPSAYLAGWVLRGIDIRTVGDGNAGAANTWSHVSRRAGAVVAVVDIAKGALAMLAAQALAPTESASLLGGALAVAGHNWPFFLGFHGGRGAATALGVLLVLFPRATIPLGLVAAVPLCLTRSTTVAFAFLYIPLPVVTWWLGASGLLIGYSAGLPFVVGVAHFLSQGLGRWERKTQEASLHPRL
jgi:glycerol-3-phosphate acyltransferase PlsY